MMMTTNRKIMALLILVLLTTIAFLLGIWTTRSRVIYQIGKGEHGWYYDVIINDNRIIHQETHPEKQGFFYFRDSMEVVQYLNHRRNKK